jgi:hypothetical protein
VKRRTLLVAAVVTLVFAIGAAAGVFLLLGDGESKQAESAPAANPEECRRLADEPARACYIREFLLMVERSPDARGTVQAIADSAWEQGGFLLSNCHGVMHTVGRTYARDIGVTPATLMDHLPRSNDPGCTAGYAHGLVTAVAPELHSAGPEESAAVCAAADTRYQRYSCIHGFGHAFMRLHDDRLEPSLEFCRSLGPRDAPDCAQGAYHDYWFAALALDGASLPGGTETNPYRLCAAQPTEFVRPCWYRAFVDNRPEGFQVEVPADLDGLCAGLSGIQRGGCITAGSVIGPPDPAAQLELCAALPDDSDASNCVRGTKVQNLLGASTAGYVDLIEGCELFERAPRAACYRWLGKTLAVVTDGAFEGEGCPQLVDADARRYCRSGARSMEDALVTFS